MIVLETSTGLCNRMRSIASAQNFSLKYHEKLLVIWPKNSELNCKYEDLFKKSDMTVCNVGWFGKKLLKFILLVFVCDNHYKVEEESEEEIERDLVLGKKIYIESYNQFSNVNYYNLFVPKDYIVNKANELVCNKNFIGVHIRRTDNIESRNNSPTELFIKKMKEKIDSGFSGCFYLSTDDLNEQNKIENEFGERVIYNKEKVFDRNTKQGMIDACIDLYSLNLCNEIIGSYWSSFTVTAAHWHKDKKIEIIEKN